MDSVFQVTPQKEVWTSKIRGSWWPNSFTNYVFTKTFMQNLHSRGSSMSSCTVLLEPTVTFIHLQQCDELLDKFLVGLSIYSGFKKQRSNYSTPRNGTPHTYFLWMQSSFSVIMWVFSSPCLAVLASYVTTKVEPRFICKKHLI